MLNKILNSISLRLILIIALSALLFILVSSAVLYWLSFRAELKNTDSNLDQLVSTVKSSAAIAAYLGDAELIKEVISGLSNNDIVDGALISSGQNTLGSEGNMEVGKDAVLKRYSLISPFIESDVVGELLINPNWKGMKHRAGVNARRYVFSMLVYAIVLLGILIALINWQLTRPITFVARQLSTLKPGSSDRLDCPDGHYKNEIGGLVRDTNDLLKSVQKTVAKERELRRIVESLQSRFEFIIENANCGIALLDLEGCAQMHNATFEQIFGRRFLKKSYNPGQSSLAEFFDEESDFLNILYRVKHEHQHVGIDLRAQNNQADEAQWLHCLFSNVSDESIGSLVELIVYDVSERARREQITQIAAEHDPLTHLYNRRAGSLRMRGILDTAHSGGNTCALMMADLDQFKPVNDLYGHEAGDQVLIKVAHRLENSVRGEDIVIRWGGDEFVIFLKSSHGLLDPVPVAKKILSELSKPFELDHGITVTIGVSIGIALFPEHGTSLEELLEIADASMYQVKNEGRNDYRLPS